MIFYIDPGVVQLIERALWERQAASLSLATRTKTSEIMYVISEVFLFRIKQVAFEFHADERTQRSTFARYPY